MAESRDNQVYMAKLAEQAERYDGANPHITTPKKKRTKNNFLLFFFFFFSPLRSEMVARMKAVAELKTELTVEERNLLSVAFKVRREQSSDWEKKMQRKNDFFFAIFFAIFFAFLSFFLSFSDHATRRRTSLVRAVRRGASSRRLSRRRSPRTTARTSS
jgi:hypothetical protein